MWFFAALVCIARIYVGAHLPLDVVGDAAFGLVVGALVNLLLSVPLRTNDDRPISGLTVADAASNSRKARDEQSFRVLCPARLPRTSVDYRGSLPIPSRPALLTMVGRSTELSSHTVLPMRPASGETIRDVFSISQSCAQRRRLGPF
jgi:hypothetical protein